MGSAASDPTQSQRTFSTANKMLSAIRNIERGELHRDISQSLSSVLRASGSIKTLAHSTDKSPPAGGAGGNPAKVPEMAGVSQATTLTRRLQYPVLRSSKWSVENFSIGNGNDCSDEIKMAAGYNIAVKGSSCGFVIKRPPPLAWPIRLTKRKICRS